MLWAVCGVAAATKTPSAAGRAIYGQLVVVGFFGTKAGDPGVEEAFQDLKAGRAAGVVFFDRNIVGRKQLAALVAHLKSANPATPPLLAIDEEGGRVERLDARRGFVAHPSAAWLAANRTPSQAKDIYRGMAAELAALGFNLNLAPVVDLALNRANTVIVQPGRSYGADPERVARYAGGFVDAHREAGVLTALKHWPGHGSSIVDTHLGISDVTERWRKEEREPFRMLIRAGKADMIMSAHLRHAEWSAGGQLPASLSARAIRVNLRQNLGFDGPVIADDLQMRAIRSNHTLADAIVLALAAGNDLVLICNVLEVQEHPAEFAVSVIEKAVRDGRLRQSVLDAAYNRVMRLKRRL